MKAVRRAARSVARKCIAAPDQRAALERGYAALLNMETPEQQDRIVMLYALRALLEGRDARSDLGIPPARGPRPGNAWWMALHFALLTRRNPDREKGMASLVANAWGVTSERVRQVYRPLRVAIAERFKEADVIASQLSPGEVIPEQLLHDGRFGSIGYAASNADSMISLCEFLAKQHKLRADKKKVK